MKLFVQILLVAACIFAVSSLSVAGIVDTGASVAENVAGAGLNVVETVAGVGTNVVTNVAGAAENVVENVAEAGVVSAVNGVEWTADIVGNAIDTADSLASTGVKVAGSVI